MRRAGELFFLFFFLIAAPVGHAQTGGEAPAKIVADPAPPHPLLEEVRSGFYSRINLVGFGVVQRPLESDLNRHNSLEIPDYQTELDLRPDFNLSFRQLELAFKPRLALRWRKWNRGVREGSEGDAEPFIHEWLARYRIADPLIVSYGRQNLQWGPSYLLSPSNPFNADNGRNNPQLEVPGLDYGRVVWIPSTAWTGSFIANTDNGRVDFLRAFKRTYALKLDYTGSGKYFSLIPSYREDGEYRVGFFGGWTVSDAFLLHAEGSFSDDRKNPRILVGGSYTLAMGPTLTAEYFRNQDGCSKEPIVSCFSSRSSVSFSEGFLIRRNYLLLQYLQSRIRDVINVTARWIRNLDDDSNRFVGIFEYELGRHTQVFLIGNALEGTRKTEFRAVVGYSLMLGVNYTF
jgi:hypothetical protein